VLRAPSNAGASTEQEPRASYEALVSHRPTTDTRQSGGAPRDASELVRALSERLRGITATRQGRGCRQNHTGIHRVHKSGRRGKLVTVAAPQRLRRVVPVSADNMKS